MKKFACYFGCLIQTEQYAIEMAVREVLPILGIEAVYPEDFSCCGEPVKSINQLITLYLSARNMAVCEKNGIEHLFVPCSDCHLALSESKRILNGNAELMERISNALANENLKYNGTVAIYHTLDLLHDHIGTETIKSLVKNPFNNIPVAVQYGCKTIRPTEVGRPDDSENPQKMENILRAIGANPLPYAEKLDCCGASLLANLPETSLTKTGQKLKAIAEQGFAAMVDVCPWCHKMYDSKQSKALETVAAKDAVPVLNLMQMLGLALGIDREKLGLNLNSSPANTIGVEAAAQ